MSARPPLFGLILAGGRSSRMGLGRPKPLLDIGGQSMIAHVAERLRPSVDRLVIATDRPDLYADLGADLVSDQAPGYAGPLAGLQAGALHVLRSGKPETGLVSVSADTPFLPRNLVARLLDGAGSDMARAAACSGRLHPVCTYWPPAALPRLVALRLDATEAPSLQSVMREQGFETVAFPASDRAPEGDPFFNVNTPADLDTARRFALSLG